MSHKYTEEQAEQLADIIIAHLDEARVLYELEREQHEYLLHHLNEGAQWLLTEKCIDVYALLGKQV